MLFIQINVEIKSISKSSLRKSLCRLPHLIHEHRKISYEIHKLNLAFRRTIATVFIVDSFGEMNQRFMGWEAPHGPLTAHRWEGYAAHLSRLDFSRSVR